MIENVPGLLNTEFEYYREVILSDLKKLGYKSFWEKINASDYGVPQLRPRAILVSLKKDIADRFHWPELKVKPKSVGQTLRNLMSANGWKLAAQWAKEANKIAPTIVGGSKKHGGPDLGPTRAKVAWAALGVNGHLIAETAPPPDFNGMPHLTVEMVARLQGFPGDWHIVGKKTNAYRQVGNAFPPPVARAVGENILQALSVSQMIQVAK
jgi:DNA (cytosine-5)-methyltransferase 1